MVNLPDPDSIPRIQSPRADVTASLGGALGGIVDTLDGLDPLSRGIVSGMLSQELGFQIPTAEEMENRRVMAQIQIAQNNKKLAGLRVEAATGAILDQKEALGVDEGILKDPNQFLALANRLGADLKQSDLILAGFESATKSPEERKGEELAQQASNLSNLETMAEAQAQAAEGEGVVGSLLDRNREQVEEQTDTDLSPGLFGDDTDTDAGGLALFNHISSSLDKLQDASGGTALTGIVGQQKGSFEDLADAPEANGLMLTAPVDGIFGEDESHKAVFFKAASVLRMAQAGNTTPAEIFKQLELPFAGIDGLSFIGAAQKVAEDMGTDVASLLKEMGLESVVTELSAAVGTP